MSSICLMVQPCGFSKVGCPSALRQGALPPWHVVDVQTILGRSAPSESVGRFLKELFFTVGFFAIGLAPPAALFGRSVEAIASRVVEPRKRRRLKFAARLRMFLYSCELLLMQWVDACLHAEVIAWPVAAEMGSVGLPKAACPSTTNSTLPGSGRLEREIPYSSCW